MNGVCGFGTGLQQRWKILLAVFKNLNVVYVAPLIFWFQELSTLFYESVVNAYYSSSEKYLGLKSVEYTHFIHFLVKGLF